MQKSKKKIILHKQKLAVPAEQSHGKSFRISWRIQCYQGWHLKFLLTVFTPCTQETHPICNKAILHTLNIQQHIWCHNPEYVAVRKKQVSSIPQGATSWEALPKKRLSCCLNRVLKLFLILLIIVQCGSIGKGNIIVWVLPYVQGIHSPLNTPNTP